MEKNTTGGIANLVKLLVGLAIIGGSYFVMERVIFRHDLQSSITSEYKLAALLAVVFVALSLWYFMFGRRARK